MTLRETAPRCQDLDLDALAYGELAPADELLARSHLALCQPCEQEHELLLAERRRFGARAGGGEPAALPSFDQLVARAERAPADTRWQAIVRGWSSPFRGAVLQGVVGMFAVGALFQVALLRPSRPIESARPRPSALAVAGSSSAPLDPAQAELGFTPSRAGGQSVAAESDCESEPEVCVEQALALGTTHAAVSVVDPCAGVPVQSSSFSSSEWSLQSAAGLETDAVCAPDAI